MGDAEGLHRERKGSPARVRPRPSERMRMADAARRAGDRAQSQ